MRCSMILSVAAAATTFAAASAAQAADLIIGSSLAEACYHAARTDDSSASALRDCDRAFDTVVRRTDRAATHVNRGIVRQLRGDVDGAWADYEAALRIEANTGEAYVNMGSIRLREGDYAAAVELIDRGLALDPNGAHTAYFNRAMALEHLGRLEEAYADLKRAAAARPDWALPRQELERYKVVSSG